ncbi:hypothetical protein GDO78_016191 [Eleutherodactylus coqui]|uniref:Uncharacterized protein n=1 Tax=Eleutherodactylus coqui TaxID=57060 RepID=A0A8J6JW49_ELECQ|nr:hypothetical protein GDO78_016191 [Eleutherodactylus coqui]
MPMLTVSACQLGSGEGKAVPKGIQVTVSVVTLGEENYKVLKSFASFWLSWLRPFLGSLGGNQYDCHYNYSPSRTLESRVTSRTTTGISSELFVYPDVTETPIRIFNNGRLELVSFI